MSATTTEKYEPRSYAAYGLAACACVLVAYPGAYIFELFEKFIPSIFLGFIQAAMIVTSAFYLPAQAAINRDKEIAAERRPTLHKNGIIVLFAATIAATFFLILARNDTTYSSGVTDYVLGPAIIAGVILLLTGSIYGGPRKAVKTEKRAHLGALRAGEQVISGSAVIHQPDESPETALTTALTFGGLPVRFEREPYHVAISGSSGSGKTEVIYGLLRSIRLRKQAARAIIFDNGGAYAKKFYRPGIDVILNPGDQRSVAWSPFSELRTRSDFARIAESMIPDGKSDSDHTWVGFARDIVISTLKAMQVNQSRDPVLLHKLLSGTVNQLAEYLEAAGIPSLADKEAMAAFAGGQTTLKPAIRYLEELQPDADFSIRDWIERTEGQDSWLFLTYRDDQMAYMRPFVATAAALAMSAVRGLDQSEMRRIFFVLDELDSVGAIPELIDSMTKGRKYGACMILGFQSLFQMRERYGENRAKTMLGSAATSVALNPGPEPENAKAIAAFFGSVEVEIRTVSTTASHSDQGRTASVSTGWSVGTQRDKDRPVVSPTDLQRLDVGQGFYLDTATKQTYLFRSAYRRDLPDLQPAEVKRRETLL